MGILANFLQGLASNHNPPDLTFSSNLEICATTPDPKELLKN
jgi:hypothetical protein